MFALAEDWDKVSPLYKLRPLFASPKLNGVRAMWDPEKKQLISRDFKVFRADILPQIYAALANFDHFLDGELYIHGVPLPAINGAVGIHRNEPSELSARVEFHAFDLPRYERMAAIRFRKLETFDGTFPPHIQIVAHNICMSAEELDIVHAANVNSGCEGTMYHHPHSLYVPARSPYMIKRKAWKDGEFPVVCVNRGEGASNKHTVGSITCVAPVHTDKVVRFEKFNVTVADTTEARYWAQWLGLMHVTPVHHAKVRYLELTERGVPHTPIYEGRV